MTHSGSGLLYRVRGCVEQWFQSRVQECIHCRECGSKITPFASHCPRCGQANPAKVSATAALYLGIVLFLASLLLFELF